jgi:hypothetical protein
MNNHYPECFERYLSDETTLERKRKLDTISDASNLERRQDIGPGILTEHRLVVVPDPVKAQLRASLIDSV